jgi:ATP-binding cassette subfamily B protein
MFMRLLPSKATQSTEREAVRRAIRPYRYNRSALMRAFGYLRPYGHMTAGAYTVGLVIIGITITVPQFIRWIVDEGIAAERTKILGPAVLGLLGLTLLKGIFVYFQGIWTERASQNVAYDLRNAIHDRLLDLSFSYHDHAQTGQLLSRSIQDVERIRFLTGRATLRLFEGVTLLLSTLVLLMLMNVPLAFLSLATMPLLAYVAFRFGRIFRPLSVAIQQQLAVLTIVIEQNLRGARIVKAYAQEEAEMRRFAHENDMWFDLALRQVRVQATNIPLIDFIASLGTVFIIWFGGSLVIRDQLSIGELVAFTTYLSQLVQPVRRLGVIIPALAMASAAGERIFEILDSPSEVENAPDAIPLPPVKGYVTFKKVSFSYANRDHVLSGISFESEPGQVIALLGTTGSGKSTVIRLISRFYEADGGSISIDGHDIKHVTLHSLRSQIGTVMQDTTLFAATVHQNIAFGRPDASEEDVINAAKAAQAHDFIMKMTHGYQTRVGERGVTLSGGQQQRIAIARALLKDPRILLLDDATASVDTETERLIQLALEKLMEGRTSFIIAQRLSTVRMADLVLVLDKGRIVARGTHQVLLEQSDLYAEIYHQQLRG